MRKKQILFGVLFFSLLFFKSNDIFAKNNTNNDTNNDTLFFKSSQQLITMLGQTIEKYGNMDYIIGKTKYSFINLQTEDDKLVILENDANDETTYTMDLSKIVIGKNVRIKDWGKKTFSIIFDKTITKRQIEKRKKIKAKRFQIMFEYKGKKGEDYDMVKKNIENILNALIRKQQL